MLWAVAVADLPVEPTAEHQSSFENIDPNVLTLCLVNVTLPNPTGPYCVLDVKNGM